MICADMPPHTRADPERRLRSSPRYCYDIQTFLPQSLSTASQQDLRHKTFRITHPFHPFRNIDFEIVEVRRLPAECRVFFFTPKGRKSSVPLGWTDIAPPDPFILLSGERTLFRVEDLLGLTHLLAEIGKRRPRRQSKIVKPITPQV